jgi:hypothetical protein
VGIKSCPCQHVLPSRVTFLAVSSAQVVRCFGVRRSSIHLLKGIHPTKNKPNISKTLQIFFLCFGFCLCLCLCLCLRLLSALLSLPSIFAYLFSLFFLLFLFFLISSLTYLSLSLFCLNLHPHSHSES